MRKFMALMVLTVIYVSLGASPAQAQCGTMQQRDVICCGNTVSVDACSSGYDACYVTFPGTYCGGNCYAATATDGYPCIAAAIAPNPARNARQTRSITLLVASCEGQYLTVAMESSAEMEDRR